MKMETTTIEVKRNTHNRLVMLRLRCKVKDLDAVIKLLIKTYKGVQIK